MQESRVNKVSRRFYIDHADDHAVVRSVPVSVEVVARSRTTEPVPTELPEIQQTAHEQRLRKLMHSAVRVPRPRSLRRRA